MANVTDEHCENRRNDIFGKVNNLKERVDKLEGGISFAKWFIALVLPFIVVLTGAVITLQIQSLRQEVQSHLHQPHK
jgi:hypothetical protein